MILTRIELLMNTRIMVLFLFYINLKIISFGSGTKGPITMLSQYMLGSAASFGFFMCKFFEIYNYIRKKKKENKVRTKKKEGIKLMILSNLYLY